MRVFEGLRYISRTFLVPLDVGPNLVNLDQIDPPVYHYRYPELERMVEKSFPGAANLPTDHHTRSHARLLAQELRPPPYPTCFGAR